MHKLKSEFDGIRSQEACQVNDTHSLLNPTSVNRCYFPSSSEQIQQIIRHCRRENLKVSVCGARHAMGGQQFASNGVLIDLSAFNQLLDLDAENGIVTVEAGINWKDLILGLKKLQDGSSESAKKWVIAQKPTGADELTLGGSLAANVHGRGLMMKPLISDVEEFTLIDAEANIKKINRTDNPELFKLVIGGYGLFGIVSHVKLRLLPFCNLLRRVSVERSADLPRLFSTRIKEGHIYGDFQFAIDPAEQNFLTEGIFSTYLPLGEDSEPSVAAKKLSMNEWKELLYLAHCNKSLAYEKYKAHYLASDGQIYASDTHQLSTYLAGYHEHLDRQMHESHKLESQVQSGPEAGRMPALPGNNCTSESSKSKSGDSRSAALPGDECAPLLADGIQVQSARSQEAEPKRSSEVIGELYVPLDRLHEFLTQAAAILREEAANVVYGTVRLIKKDDESFLPWAKQDYACTIFNLHTVHDEEGLKVTRDCFRRLISLATSLSGSFYLTYHRYAERTQIELCYPQFQQLFERKIHFDSQELFASDWWLAQKRLFDLEQTNLQT